MNKEIYIARIQAILMILGLIVFIKLLAMYYDKNPARLPEWSGIKPAVKWVWEGNKVKP